MTPPDTDDGTLPPTPSPNRIREAIQEYRHRRYLGQRLSVSDIEEGRERNREERMMDRVMNEPRVNISNESLFSNDSVIDNANFNIDY